MFIPLILYCLLLLLYWFAEGCTEGYTWADTIRRKENKLIRRGDKTTGVGKIDYHGWRFFEILGTHGAKLIIALTLLVGANLYGWYWVYIGGIKFIITGVGSMLLGMFIYERALMYVCANTYFKENGWPFYIFGKIIKRYIWQDLLIALLGLGLIVWGVVL